MQTLTSDQLGILVRIIADESGLTLSRQQFNDSVLQLFENIAGFERLSARQVTRYMRTMWIAYEQTSQRNNAR